MPQFLRDFQPDELWHRYRFCQSLLPERGGDMIRFRRCACRWYRDFCNGTTPTRSPAEESLHRARLVGGLLEEMAKIDYEIRLPPTSAPESGVFSQLMWPMMKIGGYVLAALAGLLVSRMVVMWLSTKRPLRAGQNSAGAAEGGTERWTDGEPAADESRQPPPTPLTPLTPPTWSSPRPPRPTQLSPRPPTSGVHRPAASDAPSAPAADSPPSYPTLPPRTPPAEEQPPPSYQEVCRVIHC